MAYVGKGYPWERRAVPTAVPKFYDDEEYGAQYAGSAGGEFSGGGRKSVIPQRDYYDPRLETGEEFLRRMALLKYLAERAEAIEK